VFSISKLNEMQEKIVKDTEGAILVTAGAGSGKTRLLTHRICYIIEKKLAYPENILAITFTNKATNEMKQRINSMLDNANGIWISTFHAMCVRILRDNISKSENYTKYFTIYDENDKDRIIKNIIKRMDISNNEFKSKLTWHMANAKNKGEELNSHTQELQYEPYKNEIIRASQMYEETLKENNALDFDDLLLKTLQLFRNCPETLKYYQEKFKYIHVDEFQDTNIVQYQIVKMLASGKNKNIFVVGDEDQCIYCWRGANIENIKNFVIDFQCKVYKLEQNYRSTKTIIATANKLIKNNKERIDKTLFTNNEVGEKITCYKAYDENDEAEYVAKTIIGLINNGVSRREIGVLMRISSLSRLVEEKLLNYNISYKVSGIFKFFERLEIKNVIAYLNVIINNRDSTSLLRILNVPKRGIGEVTALSLVEQAKKQKVSIFNLIKDIENLNLSKSVICKIQPFANLLNELMEKKDNLPLSDFIKELLKSSGINDMYNNDTDEDEDRRRNLEQLILSAESFEKLTGGGIAEYLESVTLQTSVNEDDEENSVSVSTVHASKGLEFDYVFIIGLEENCFPLARKMEIEDIEEERRLAYVAITRARKKVYLTRAASRFLYGNKNLTVESRFVKESGLDTCTSPEINFGNKNNYGEKNKYSSKNNPSFNNKIKKETTPRVSNYKMNDFKDNKIINKNDNEKLFEKFNIGVAVSHPTFGEGIIKARENVGEITFVTVQFDGFGVKKLALSFAPLKLLKK